MSEGSALKWKRRLKYLDTCTKSLRLVLDELAVLDKNSHTSKEDYVRIRSIVVTKLRSLNFSHRSIWGLLKLRLEIEHSALSAWVADEFHWLNLDLRLIPRVDTASCSASWVMRTEWAMKEQRGVFLQIKHPSENSCVWAVKASREAGVSRVAEFEDSSFLWLVERVGWVWVLPDWVLEEEKSSVCDFWVLSMHLCWVSHIHHAQWVCCDVTRLRIKHIGRAKHQWIPFQLHILKSEGSVDEGED